MSVEVEYNSLREKQNESEGWFRKEILSFLEEAAKMREEEITEEERTEQEEFNKALEEEFPAMNKMFNKIVKEDLAKELKAALDIQNGEKVAENDHVWHYFSNTSMLKMKPEILSYHIDILNREIMEEDKNVFDKHLV